VERPYLGFPPVPLANVASSALTNLEHQYHPAAILPRSLWCSSLRGSRTTLMWARIANHGPGCPGVRLHSRTQRATVVQRLVDAGAIVVGNKRTSTNIAHRTGGRGRSSPMEHAPASTTTDISLGGSSSGSAVAVAKGMGPVFSLRDRYGGLAGLRCRRHSII